MSQNGKNKVIFFYDLISPWSYLAYHLLKRNQKAWNLDIELAPCVLGYVFKFAGNRAPLVVVNKGNMMSREFRLFSDFYKIPTSDKAWTYSSSARTKPPNSLNLMRFMHVVNEQKPDILDAVTEKLFDRIFAEGDTEIFNFKSEALHSVLGSQLVSKSEMENMLKKASAPETKEGVQARAQEIVEKHEAYGVPYMVITKPDGKTGSFMGSDRFELIADWLGVSYGGKGAALQQSKL